VLPDAISSASKNDNPLKKPALSCAKLASDAPCHRQAPNLILDKGRVTFNRLPATQPIQILRIEPPAEA
jgi:hypothetical protein